MRLPLAATAACVLIVDQWTKLWIVGTLAPGERRDVVPGLMTWIFVQNRRGAYGLFGDSLWVHVALALTVLVVFAFAFREFMGRSTPAAIAFGSIAGGALGNIIDRFHYHYVVDFIAIQPLPFFEVFNVADSCVSAGVVALVLLSLADGRTASRRVS